MKQVGWIYMLSKVSFVSERQFCGITITSGLKFCCLHFHFLKAARLESLRGTSFLKLFLLGPHLVKNAGSKRPVGSSVKSVVHRRASVLTVRQSPEGGSVVRSCRVRSPRIMPFGDERVHGEVNIRIHRAEIKVVLLLRV
jgi:hypothetical protein